MPRYPTVAASFAVLAGCALASPRVFQQQPPMSVSFPTEARLVQSTGLLALYFPAPPNAPTIVHFHENAEQLNDVVGLGKRFQRAGLGFFAVEYPGYGMASGATSEASVYDAGETAIKYLRAKLLVANASIVLEGATLGAGVATEMARRGYGARVVLIAPFLSEDALLAPTTVTDHFDVAAKAPQVTQPVLIVQGSDDEIVPLSMGQQLSKAFPHATLRIVKGATHVDALDPPPVFDEIVQFANPGVPPIQTPPAG